MRNGKRTSRRGAVPATAAPERELRGEIAAIAVLAFAALSLVAIVTGQGQILGWWRAVLVGLLGAGAALVPLVLGLFAAAFWWPALRGALVMPLLGGPLAVLALLGVAEVAFAAPGTTGAGGGIGRGVGRGLEDLLGTWGALVALIALFAVGLVLAAERSIADLVGSVVRRRPAFALRRGMTLPSGTVAPPKRDERPALDESDDEEEDATDEIDDVP